MDHTRIEEHQIAERYVQGTLPADEAGRFENHYLSCPECLDRLALAESVQRGFRRAATQDAERLSSTRQLALLAWLSHFSRRGQAGVLLAVLLVLAVLPALVVSRGAAGREREQLSRGNFPILPLEKERGAEDFSAEPTHRLRLPKAGPVVLAPQVDPPFQPSYRARLLDRQGHEIHAWQGLHPDDRDTLSLSLSAQLLPPGVYSLRVDGITPGTKPALAARFEFRALPP
jgi:hypothetical protein